MASQWQMDMVDSVERLTDTARHGGETMSEERLISALMRLSHAATLVTGQLDESGLEISQNGQSTEARG